MKKITLLIGLFCNGAIAFSQLSISSGTQFSISGNAQVTLQNMDLQNNGNFTSGSGTVTFSGNSNTAIKGSQPLEFYNIEINKESGKSVILQKMISISNDLKFTAGLIDLNSYNIDLGSTGSLLGEKESSHVTGIIGGQVISNADLDNPSATNPGNLGAIITTSKNLGNVIIKRGHQSQENTVGMGSSVLRYYDITPENNTNMNVTLRFDYLDEELNGISEGNLVLYKSDDNVTWMNQNYTTRDGAGNYVEKTGINSFSRWTLSEPINALPLMFNNLYVKCENRNNLIKWKTATEINVSHFSIETSNNGTQWKAIGQVTATGNSGVEINYSFTDVLAEAHSMYRIVAVDKDGHTKFSKIVSSPCASKDLFTFWPNPTNNVVNLIIESLVSSPAIIRIYDAKGVCVKVRKENLVNGKNQIKISISEFAKGVYLFNVTAENGIEKTFQVIKN